MVQTVVIYDGNSEARLSHEFIFVCLGYAAHGRLIGMNDSAD